MNTKRISREHTIPQELRHSVREPIATVELGETFVVETINDPSPIIREPKDADPEVVRGRQETGPIFVEGIEPGDVLAIEIIAIQPEGHAAGGGAEGRRRSFLPIQDGRVHFPGGLVHPLEMMIGDIRVQPRDAERWENPWDYGGNMDFKDISPGHVLLLKAQLPGGLLVLGDVHAAQGDGELETMAAECAAEVTLRITRETAWPVERPTIRKPHSFVSLACRWGPDGYWQARDQAIEDATKILAHITGCSESAAGLYVRTVGNLRNGAIWAGGKSDPDWYQYVPLVVGLEVPLHGTYGASPCGDGAQP